MLVAGVVAPGLLRLLTRLGSLTLFLRLLLLLTVVPFVELWILLWMAETFSWQHTLALVILTGVVGTWLARREGIKTLARIQADLNHGIAPAGALVDAALILVAGVLLVTPGVLTDLFGFLLLVPPARRWIARRVGSFLRNRVTIMQAGAQPVNEPSSLFVDVEATSRDADDPTRNNDAT